VSDERAAFEGDPKGSGVRMEGHAGEVRSRRDAKRRARARAQLNNGLPYPPSLLTRALRLFVSLRRSRCRRHRRRYYSSLIFSPYRSFILFSPRSFFS